jgi:hypothetical protein
MEVNRDVRRRKDRRELMGTPGLVKIEGRPGEVILGKEAIPRIRVSFPFSSFFSPFAKRG